MGTKIFRSFAKGPLRLGQILKIQQDDPCLCQNYEKNTLRS